MKAMTNKELIDGLLTTPAGQIILCNLLDGVTEKLIPDDTLKEFLGWWRASVPYFEAFDTATEDSDPLLDTLELLTLSPEQWASMDASYPGLATLGPKPDFRALCHRVARGKGVTMTLMTTLNTAAFFEYLAADKKNELLGTLALDVTVEGSRVHATFHDGRKSARLDSLKPGSRFGPGGGIFWFTQADMIRSDVKDGDADAVRDILGLAHIGENIDLVAIEFRAASQARHGRPTALDAGGNQRFKSAADTSGAKARSSWGHTANLNRRAAGRKCIDGTPERICKSVPADSVELIEIHVVGRTKLHRGNSNMDDDRSFAQRLAHGKSPSDLRTAILNLL